MGSEGGAAEVAYGEELAGNVMSTRLTHRTVSAKTAGVWIVLALFSAAASMSIAASKHSGSIDVGTIALLASPQKYNGKVISTIGFLNIGSMPENDNLWLYEQDGEYNLYRNMFALGLSDDQRKQFAHLNHTYVMITGTFRSNAPGSTVMDSGSIVHIAQVDGWQPYRLSSPAKQN